MKEGDRGRQESKMQTREIKEEIRLLKFPEKAPINSEFLLRRGGRVVRSSL